MFKKGINCFFIDKIDEFILLSYMLTNPQIIAFLESLEQVLEQGSLVKMTLSKTQKAEEGLKSIHITQIEIKGTTSYSFTYRFKTKDRVDNHSKEETLKVIGDLLGSSFLQALVISTSQESQLLISKKGKVKLIQKNKDSLQRELKHNKKKNYLISTKDNIYLRELGITDAKGRVHDKMQDKYKQINRYVELMSHWFEKLDTKKKLKIVDMGSGKGYLTFALYDYLVHQIQLDVEITGVELRENLVELCNGISKKCDFNKLNFLSKDINDFQEDEIDIIIALHACDTATDLAIYKGITADAQLIVCAPCCHKQVRKDMKGDTKFKSILKHGIFEERQAETLTDTIRALLMEKSGYQAKAFEFISNEHTRKNVMLVGRKVQEKRDLDSINQQIDHLKEQFGIQRQELEDLLNS